MGGHVHFWSPAGSEAPRRFAFGARASPEPCVTTDARRKSKAPSPLRSAGELQNLAPGASNCLFTPPTPFGRNEPIYKTARSNEKIYSVGYDIWRNFGDGQRANHPGRSAELGPAGSY